MKTIGERLEWALTLRDKSIREVQLQLQERSVKGSSYASFHGYVKGGQVPPLELLEAVAGLLEVRPAWLAFGEGEPLEIAEQVASKARAAERQPGGSQGLVLRHPFQDVQDRIPLPPRAIKEDIDRVVSWYVYAVALRMIDEAVNAEIARLTRELEEARERERRVRSAVIRANAALVRLDLRWDPREEAEWVRRGPVVEIATRLKDEVLALSTPQEASGAD